MSTRANPQTYFRTKAQAEVTAPPQQPLPVQVEYAPSLQLPELNTTALVIVAVVGVIGLLAFLAFLSSDKKCR